MAGAWSRDLAKGFGDAVPLDTERGYNTTLPVGSFDVKRQLTFPGHGFVITPMETGLRVGGAVEFGGLDLPPNFARSEAMLKKASMFLPGLRTEGGRQWMGYRPSMPDSVPVIGRASGRQHLLRLRPWPSWPHAVGGDRAAYPRSRHGCRAGNRHRTFQATTFSELTIMARHSFFCVDGHTCGNPVRLVAGGGPNLEGSTMMEKRAHFLAEYDWIRTGLMFEPRGHDMMSGSILYPPTRPDCDVAVLFIETSGCLPMCGHGTIGTVTMAIEQGLVTPKTPGKLNLDTPAGLVAIEYEQNGQYVERVRLTNVPAFLYAEGLEVECPDLGSLKVDVAYGGNFYAIVEPQENYTDMEDYSALQLIAWSPVLRQRLNEKYKFQHPLLPDINRLSHILWTGKAKHPEAHARNAVFMATRQSTVRPAEPVRLRAWRSWLPRASSPGDEFVHESIIGSLFHGRVERAAEVAGRPAIVPSIAGWARMTGYNTIFIDDRDPFAHGFTVA